MSLDSLLVTPGTLNKLPDLRSGQYQALSQVCFRHLRYCGLPFASALCLTDKCVSATVRVFPSYVRHRQGVFVAVRVLAGYIPHRQGVSVTVRVFLRYIPPRQGVCPRQGVPVTARVFPSYLLRSQGVSIAARVFPRYIRHRQLVSLSVRVFLSPSGCS